MFIPHNQEERKRQLEIFIYRRPTPITCEELLLPLLNFTLQTFDELESLDRCFDLSHQETYNSLPIYSLIKDIKLGISLSVECLSQIRASKAQKIPL